MDPISWVLIGAAIAAAVFGGGMATGAAVKGDGGAKTIAALEQFQIANGEAFDAITSHIDTLAESDALVADRLTEVPPPCLPDLGGDPMSPECAWALCLRQGQSDAQRCEAGDLQRLLVQRWQAEASCPEVTP